VAGLAADAIADLELRTALPFRHVIGMAIEADLRCSSVGQAQVGRDAPGLRQVQRPVGLGMAVFERPGAIFVQGYVLARLRRHFSVANAARTARDAEMLVIRDDGFGSDHLRANQHELDGETADG